MMHSTWDYTTSWNTLTAQRHTVCKLPVCGLQLVVSSKLSQFTVSPAICQWISSFLISRKQRVNSGSSQVTLHSMTHPTWQQVCMSAEGEMAGVTQRYNSSPPTGPTEPCIPKLPDTKFIFLIHHF